MKYSLVVHKQDAVRKPQPSPWSSAAAATGSVNGELTLVNSLAEGERALGTGAPTLWVTTIDGNWILCSTLVIKPQNLVFWSEVVLFLLTTQFPKSETLKMIEGVRNHGDFMEAGTEAKEKASSRVTQLPAADRTRTRPSDLHTVLSISTTPNTSFFKNWLWLWSVWTVRSYSAYKGQSPLKDYELPEGRTVFCSLFYSQGLARCLPHVKSLVHSC